MLLLTAVVLIGCDPGAREPEEVANVQGAIGTGTGLKAEYYDNQDLTAHKVTRTDATVNFNWGTGSPASSIAVDTFSARWTGFIEPLYSETYTFSLSSDDGVRLWVNGVLLIDAWVNGAAERNGTIALTAGQKVPIQIEYYESSSNAVARLFWASASQPKGLVPSSQLYLPVEGRGTGLRVRYYDNQDLTNLKVSRTEGPVNFNWGSGSPDPAIGVDTFSSRWNGVIEPLYSENYTFYTLSDDGVRLWVDGVLLIDNWTNHTAVENRGAISLTAGRRYAIQLDHYDSSSSSTLRLSWSSVTQARQIVPASQLYPEPVPGAAPQLVGTLSAPGSGATGQAISLSWTVTNQGGGTAQPNWYDTVYLSTDALPGGDTLLTGASTVRTAALATGESYSVTRSVTLPRITPGSYSLIFKTDVEDHLFESEEADNFVVVPLTVLGADLVTTAFTAPAQVANGERVAMTWTVENRGTATANGQWYTSYPASNRWYDKVYLSTDATWDAADTFVGEVARVNTSLAVGASYVVKTDLQLPKVYPEGAAFLLVVTDKNGDVVETDEANNTYTVPITVLRQDLSAQALTAPEQAAPGELLALSWRVRNIGTGTAHGQWYTSYPASYRWYDKVYLSTDAAWDAADTFVGEVARVNTPLAANDSYTTSATMQLPSVANGAWYLLVFVDKNGDLNEQSEDNNVFALPITLGRADLVVDAFTAPSSAANGERVTLSWTARNAGTNTANGKWYTSYPASYRWYDKVYLSTDAVWDAADTFVGEVARTSAPLAADATYTSTVTLQLPKVYPEGAAHLLVVLDKNGDVSEQSEENNAFALPLSVTRPEFAIDAVTAPAEVAAGELASLSWTVRNAGTGTAHGQWYTSGTDSYRWYDKVYLSADGVLDAADTFVGEVARVNATLGVGATYTVTTTLQIPTTVADGAWSLLAVIDANKDVNEQSEDNNVFALPIKVGRADLVVDAFTAPSSAANGERVTLSWTARNAGTNTANGKWYTSGTDSYRWYDKVYLSTDAVLDAADTLLGEVARVSSPLGVGAAYTSTTILQLPKVYPEGAAHLLVALDRNGDVSEQSEENNTFALPLTVLRPDLIVDVFTAPAELAAGELASLSWTVRNAGTGRAHGQLYTSGTDSYRWYDKVYLSADGVLDAADTFVGEVVRTNATLGVGATYTVTTTLQIPTHLASGSYAMLVVADANGDVNERSEEDNLFAMPVTLGRADLVVEAFTAPASAANGERVTLSWTARNAGTNTANGKWYSSGTDSYRWYDKVYLSTDAVWDAADTFVGEVARTNAPLAAGATYLTTTAMQLPKAYAEGATHLLVVLDQNGDVSEQSEGNNTFVLPLTVTRPDLVAEAFTAPGSAAPNELISLSWTARNVGTGTAHGQWHTSGTDGYRWYDKVYLSADEVLDAADKLVGEVARTNAPVAAGASYTASVTMQVPTVANGAWYLLAVIDQGGDLVERAETNNLFALPISIGRADLVADSFTAPTEVASGELVAFSATVRNAGTNSANGRWYTTSTDSYRWYDKVYLSTDAVLDAADTLLGEVARVNAPLVASATYALKATFQVPSGTVPGSYYFLAALDHNGDVSESDETNNVAASLAVTITRADLVVDAFTGPSEAATGQPVSLSWTVRNTGTGKANGRWYTDGADSYRWYDRVFLSTDAVLDSADLLVGSLARTNTPLAPGATYTATASLAIPPAPAGSYFLLVVADVSGDVNEDNEDNNVRAASAPISLSAPDLKPVSLNGPDASLTQVPVTLSWTVTNVGSGAAIPTWDDDIYLTADEDCCGDANDVKVTSVSRTPDLAPGASYTVTVTVELPKVPSGPYHLVLRTKSGTSMFDADDTNDMLARPIEIHGTVEETIVSLDGTAGSALKSPRFSPDGSRLVVADGTKARVFELVTFTERGIFAEHTAAIDSVAFSPTGDQVLSGAQDGSARIWDSIAFSATTTLSSSAGPNQVAYSRDGARVLVGNGTGAKLFSAVTGAFLRSFSGHTSTVTAVTLSPDGALAATASADKTARLWNTATGALVRTLTGHTAQVNAVAFAPGGGELLTASNDGTLRFWNLETGAESGRLIQGSKVGDASWSSDGQYVVSSDESSVSPGLGYLWKRSTLEGVRTFYHYHEIDCVDLTKSCGAANRTPGKMTGIALSPDRTMVVGTQPNGKIRVWPSGLTAIIPDTTVTLTPGVGAPITLRPNSTYHFRVDAAAWDSLVMTMEGSATAGASFASNAGTDPLAVQMLAKYGTSPSAASRDHADRAYASRIRTRIPVVNSREGTYYVSLSAPFLTEGAITGTLTVQSDPFEVASASPHRVGNAGSSTFAVKGTGLSAETQVELVSPSGALVPATRVLDLDHDTLGVTVNLTQAELGTYAVRATNPVTGQTSTLPGAITVAQGAGGSLRTWVEGPTAVRGSTVRPLKVRWKNEGDADLAAPILVLSSSAGQSLLDANWVPTSGMQVIASGEGFPGDVLPPGAEGSFTFDHRFPNVSGTTTIQIGLASEDSGPFNWEDLKPLVTPRGFVGDATWETVWNDATAALGRTRGQAAASFRRVNVHSTSPASLEAVVAWALWSEMSNHPLVRQESGPSARAVDGDSWGMAATASPNDVQIKHIQGGWPGGGGINPFARTFVLSHGWNSNPSTFNDLVGRIARDYPDANIVAVDWSKLAGTGVLHPVRAARNGSLAGALAADKLRDMGITDNITHVTHSHGQFVAEGIAKNLGGTQKLLALDAASPMGHGFKWPDYSAFKGGAAQFVNPYSIADDWFPHNRVPRGFVDGQHYGLDDLLGHNAAKKMATTGAHSIDNLFNTIRSGQLGFKLGFRGSVLFAGADILICQGSIKCGFALALAESIIFWNPTPLVLWGIFTVLSLSPEEIRGPAPHGETVSRAAPWNYEVVFWNSAKAAGPVQELVVIEYLDANLDWSSVDFNIVEYGGRLLEVPSGVTTSWSTRDIPTVNGCTMVGTAEGELAVDITLDYDPQMGRIEWRLKVVDTALEDFPWDPYAGILPPPDEKFCGRGHVTYTVLPRGDVADGEAVHAKAGVIFDTNPVSYTNTVTHYIGP